MKTTHLLLLFALCAPVAAQNPPKHYNLLPNGGFETWQDLSAEEKAKPENVAKDGSIATGYWFSSEAYERTQDPKFPIKVAIAKDDTTKHGDKSAVRIVNGATTDIGSVVLQPISIAPGFHYILRGWMKGDNIVKDEKTGLGVALWTNVGPKEDFWGKMKNDLYPTNKKDGTFDWTPFEVKFDVPATSNQVMFSLQLRRASGTLWFDDVELVSGEKVADTPAT